MAVARPVRDSCSVTPTGALLVSSAHPGIKLHFPPDSTAQTRSVTLQVTFTKVFLTYSSPSATECSIFRWTSILHRCCRFLSQQSRLCVVILRSESAPFSVCPRIPACISFSQSKFRSLYHLDSQVHQNQLHSSSRITHVINICSISAGHTADLSCLHLLHGDPAAQTWTDITSQVSLYVTHLYAIFYITHFSWWVPVLISELQLLGTLHSSFFDRFSVTALPTQVLALVYHSALCQWGGPEGLPAPKTIQSPVPCPSEEDRSLPGSAAVFTYQ